ncbi:hypothetical protein [uncultured Sulfitobacter sp.]|uniref:tyrosine-type recombinase/integrase n=1 Tax=uncultured Sulfitobacter sp. TaxID=191468 RepID=UPI00261CDB14|nr:hypothetical protein [uncultured Sulfitobacter sp.]
MGTEKHSILGDKVHVYRRENSRYWQSATFLNGKNHRVSTKEESLKLAKEFAEDWYLTLRGKQSRGELKNERTFAKAGELFLREFEADTMGERNPKCLSNHSNHLRLHLTPFLGPLGLSEITTTKIQEYRIARLQSTYRGKHPAAATLQKEIVTLRMTLKAAVRHGWLDHIPDLTAPYRSSTKVSHRAWFSPDEYKQLYTATRANIKAMTNGYHVRLAEQLHDKILFMANTGIRPDEANWLEYRDVDVVEDDATGETILEIEVRGKRGVGYCKSTIGAVRPFQRMIERNQPEPTDRLFPADHKKQFNRILEELNLKFDREGNRRTLYSLRHSYISFRLLEGADIYQIAKNCRTSVEMIEKHYAVHLKNSLDAAAINVRKVRP